MLPTTTGEVALLGIFLLLVALIFLVTSLMGAIFLRLASAWVGMGASNFGTAIKVSLTTHFVQGLLSALAFCSLGPTLAEPRPAPDEMHRRLIVWFPPLTGLMVLASLVIMHAVLFCLMLEASEGEPIKFLSACALAMIYLAIYTAFLIGVYLGWSVMVVLLFGPPKVGVLSLPFVC